MSARLVYKVAFSTGVVVFVGSLAGGVGYVVTRQHRLPGLPSPLPQYLTRGELRRAAVEHYLASRIDPTSYANAPELAEAMRRAGDAEGEIEQYRQARERWPLDPATHRALGRACCRYQLFDEGIASLREALRLDPGDPRTLLALGDAWLEQDRFAQAVASYSEAVRLEPGNAAVHNSLGIAYALSGEHRRAIEAFPNALRLSPRPEYVANLERARRAEEQAAAPAQRLPR